MSNPSTSESNQNEDDLFALFKECFLNTYSPVNNPLDATAFMSTYEIYDSFKKMFPNNKHDVESIAKWLHENKFKFYEVKTVAFAWMVKLKDVKKKK